MQNLITKGGRRTFCLSNYCFNIRDLYSIVWDIYEVRSMSYESKHRTQPPSNTPFCAYLTLVTQKLHVKFWCSRYWMTALRSEMSIFCVKGRCKILVAKYASKCASQSLSISHFCVNSVLRHITWKLQVICGSLAYRATAIVSEAFFCGLELYWRLNWRTTAWDTIGLSPIRHCLRILRLYIHRYFVRNYAWQQNSLILWLHTYTTHQTTDFTVLLQFKTMQSWLATRHIAISINLVCYFKITRRGSTVPLYEFAAKQPKKGIN